MRTWRRRVCENPPELIHLSALTETIKQLYLPQRWRPPAAYSSSAHTHHQLQQSSAMRPALTRGNPRTRVCGGTFTPEYPRIPHKGGSRTLEHRCLVSSSLHLLENLILPPFRLQSRATVKCGKESRNFDSKRFIFIPRFLSLPPSKRLRISATLGSASGFAAACASDLRGASARRR